MKRSFHSFRVSAAIWLLVQGTAWAESLDLKNLAPETAPDNRAQGSLLAPKTISADLQARIDAFLTDPDGRLEFDVPGLTKFRKLFLDAQWDKGRALYRQILKSPYNVELFVAIDSSQAEGGRAIADRRHAMYWNEEEKRPFPSDGRPVQPHRATLADIAALLFAESVIDPRNITPNLDPRDPASRIKNPFNVPCGITFLSDPQFLLAIRDGGDADAEAYRIVARQFLATRSDPIDLSIIVPYLGCAPLNQFEEAVTLNRRIVSTNNVNGISKGMALDNLVEVRGKDEIPYLTTLLDDSTLITPTYFTRPDGQTDEHPCLMKDVALAFLITLRGEDPGAYGFENPRGQVLRDLDSLGVAGNVFTSEAKRSSALAKWKANQLLIRRLP